MQLFIEITKPFKNNNKKYLNVFLCMTDRLTDKVNYTLDAFIGIGNLQKKIQDSILHSRRENNITLVALRTVRQIKLYSSFATKNLYKIFLLL